MTRFAGPVRPNLSHIAIGTSDQTTIQAQIESNGVNELPDNLFEVRRLLHPFWKGPYSLPSGQGLPPSPTAAAQQGGQISRGPPPSR